MRFFLAIKCPKRHRKELREINKPLTVTLHIGGKQVDTLTAEQCEKMAQRLGEVMSRYYTNHLDEYQQIKEK